MDQHAQNSPSSVSPHFTTIPSPPPGSAVRRHQSLTYGTATGGVKKIAPVGLRRAGTQVRPSGHHAKTPSPSAADEEFAESSTGHEDESYFTRQASSPVNRSPWSTPSNEWRSSGSNAALVGSNNGTSAIDDAQRSLASLDINSQAQSYPAVTLSGAQSTHPPRFNSNQPQQSQQFTALRTAAQNDNDGNASRKLQLITDMGERGGQLPGGSSGPASASAYVPPIGHGLPQSTAQQQRGGASDYDDRAITASGTWDQKERVLHNRSSNPNMNYGPAAAQQQAKAQGIPSVPPIPAQFLSQQQNLRLGLNTQVGGLGVLGAQPGILTSPVDIPALVATKGYNPQNFDTRPAFVRRLRKLSSETFLLTFFSSLGSLFCN
jgi:YTH domain-containing family protein